MQWQQVGSVSSFNAADPGAVDNRGDHVCYQLRPAAGSNATTIDLVRSRGGNVTTLHLAALSRAR